MPEISRKPPESTRRQGQIPLSFQREHGPIDTMTQTSGLQNRKTVSRVVLSHLVWHHDGAPGTQVRRAAAEMLLPEAEAEVCAALAQVASRTSRLITARPAALLLRAGADSLSH